METLDQLVKQRLTKLNAVRKAGSNPYETVFKRDGSMEALSAAFQEGKSVKAAGRLSALRAHGKNTFADLRDQTGKLQLLFSTEVLSNRYEEVLHLDLGDWVGASGSLFKTKTGESTIRVENWAILSKALRPPPEKWHGLQNQELRYRKRYLDLLSNPDARQVFLMRSRLMSEIRRFLDARGFLEVETPMMQPIPGGAAGRPFKTHHKALGLDLYLRIAPELYLKKLLVGGFDRVYELGRNYRNEGISTRHNPEFTMLEVYEAYGNCETMMQLTEEMITTLAQSLLGSLKFEYCKKTVDLTRPWKRFSFAEHMAKAYGIHPTADVEEWFKKLSAKGVELPKGKKPSRSWLVNFIAELLEPESAGRPVFVVDYFSDFAPLAKTQPGKPELSDRFELFIGGLELANAYTEQNDPIEQRKKLEAYREIGGEEAQVIDEDFLEALEHGMPPAGGLGVGIDRLSMLLAGKETIRDVILFPTLRPEERS